MPIRLSRLSLLLPTLLVIAGNDGRAADPIVGRTMPPANRRFADGAADEVPDFQRHVVPLLGRLGCNGRACHGSFQGRGGFRLSLFGYDFNMDHKALKARAKLSKPAESLMIMKPTLQKEHEGGKRFAKGSWEYHLLHRWLQAGAKRMNQPREIEKLSIEPPEVVFAKSNEGAQLRVVAVWRNGEREDVTPLCRFRTNDDSVATISSNGRLQSVGPGDTHVIAFYDNGVASVPVLRPHSKAKVPPSGTAHLQPIDRYISAKLSKLGIQASPLCTDSEFLRRVSIDLTGTLPTPDEVTRFLADKSKEKRRKKIDELLERPAYAAWWANKLCDFTGCNPRQQAELGQETSVQWYRWIYARLRENVPYDQLIARIVLARGRRDGQSYDDYAQEVSAYYREKSPAKFSNRSTLPHYWTRRTLAKPEDKALAFAHSFLGIRLQCAQCHKHPFAPWTQTDFRQFAEFFRNIQYGVPPKADKRYRALAGKVGLRVRGKNGAPVRKNVLRRAREGGVVPWRELYIKPLAKPVSLRLLRSGTIKLATNDDPRQPIMDWMSEPGNPWFARALVNRVWAGYFHAGIVEPPDDLNPANPPSNPALLNWLSREFVAHKFDMKWLHRQIVLSDAYQRSWRPNNTNRNDRRNFSRAIPRRIPAEIVYDGLKQAVAASSQLEQVRADLSRRAIGHLSMRLAGTYAMHVFGKPDRGANCDCERVNQPTLLQSIFLNNDPLVEQRLEQSGWVREVMAKTAAGKRPGHDHLVRMAWLRTVCRPPTKAEMSRAKSHLANSESLAGGLRDLLWALINTKEFILN